MKYSKTNFTQIHNTYTIHTNHITHPTQFNFKCSFTHKFSPHGSKWHGMHFAHPKQTKIWNNYFLKIIFTAITEYLECHNCTFLFLFLFLASILLPFLLLLLGRESRMAASKLSSAIFFHVGAWISWYTKSYLVTCCNLPDFWWNLEEWPIWVLSAQLFWEALDS